MEKKNCFRSRISVLLIGFIFLFLLPAFILKGRARVYPDIAVLIGVFMLVILVFSGMRYVVSEEKLRVKIWFIPFGCVRVGDILSVERSYNPLSSPAASLKRLRIGFAKGRYWLISPVDEQRFIETLKSINPDIYVHVPVKKGIWRVQDWDI